MNPPPRKGQCPHDSADAIHAVASVHKAATGGYLAPRKTPRNALVIRPGRLHSC